MTINKIISIISITSLILITASAGVDTTIQEKSTMQPVLASSVKPLALPTSTYTLPEPKPTLKEAPARTPRASRSRAPRPVTKRSQKVSYGDPFGRLAQCETGGRNIANPSGKYRGYFQFDFRTWRSVGGTGDPMSHSYAQQRAKAVKLQARSGWSPWPQCARKLGLL